MIPVFGTSIWISYKAESNLNPIYTLYDINWEVEKAISMPTTVNLKKENHMQWKKHEKRWYTSARIAYKGAFLTTLNYILPNHIFWIFPHHTTPDENTQLQIIFQHFIWSSRHTLKITSKYRNWLEVGAPRCGPLGIVTKLAYAITIIYTDHPNSLIILTNKIYCWYTPTKFTVDTHQINLLLIHTN